MLKQDRVDSRADLYALGMTLYETVTGALPGYGKPSIDVIRMHLDEDDPSAVVDQSARAARSSSRSSCKLLEKDPRHRYRLGRGAAAGRRRRRRERQRRRGELLVGTRRAVRRAAHRTQSTKSRS